MTEGRFETSYNLRNTTFENRPFWAKSHKMDPESVRKHAEQESCPYHDLRANGCFMPHDWGGAQANTATLTAEQVMKRPAGASMKMAMGRNKNTGCGGAIMAEDTDPLPVVPAVKVNSTPWTSTGKGKTNGLFSVPEYISAKDREKPKPQYEPPFHTGASNTTMGKPFAFVPGDTAKKQPPPKAFRLKAGTYKAMPLPPVARLASLSPKKLEEASSPKSAPVKKKKTEFKKREPFSDKNRSLQGTFGKADAHLPTPYHEPKQNEVRNFTMFTYAAKSKRGQPIQCQWDSAPNAVRVVQ